MQSIERENFEESLATCLGMFRQPIDVKAIDIWWACLSPYTMEQVAAGFRALMTDTEFRGAPMPKDIIARMPKRVEYHRKQELPQIARDSGMAGILDHLESKQERGSRGAEWVKKIRENLARDLKANPRTLGEINYDRHVLGLRPLEEKK